MKTDRKKYEQRMQNQVAGVDISYMGYAYAAAEAAGLAEKQVTNGELQPGDLVFYSYTKNGRY